MQLMPTLPIGSGRGRARRLGDPGFYLQRRHASDRSRLVFATLQDGLRDIVAPLPSARRGVARAHPVAAVDPLEFEALTTFARADFWCFVELMFRVLYPGQELVYAHYLELIATLLMRVGLRK